MSASDPREAMIRELKQLIVKEADKDMAPEDIASDARLIGGELDLDSLDALQIALAVKERYGVRIEGGPDSRKAFESVTTLADFILAARAAKA